LIMAAITLNHWSESYNHSKIKWFTLWRLYFMS
jgi:hypothetical protein